jgi:hypothetical protein
VGSIERNASFLIYWLSHLAFSTKNRAVVSRKEGKNKINNFPSEAYFRSVLLLR